MQTTTIDFPHNSRRVFTAVKHLFQTYKTQFTSLDYDEDLFVLELRRGAWLSPFSEKIKIKVVATGSQTSLVKIESSSRSILNLVRLGANKGNLSDLCDYICNEVGKLCQPGEIRMIIDNNRLS